MSAVISWFKKVFHCDQKSVSSTQASGPLAPLCWELPNNDGQVNQGAHPERAPWSKALFAEALAKWDIIKNAKDWTTIYPRFFELNQAQQISVFCELMARVAEYECSWNPRETSKDVNGRSDLDSLATGFFQLNVADQKTYETGTNFTHNELLDPYNNIKAGIGIIATMVRVRGKITRSPGDPGFRISEFFETLIFGAKYESITKILPKVKIYGDQFLK